MDYNFAEHFIVPEIRVWHRQKHLHKFHELPELHKTTWIRINIV